MTFSMMSKCINFIRNLWMRIRSPLAYFTTLDSYVHHEDCSISPSQSKKEKPLNLNENLRKNF